MTQSEIAELERLYGRLKKLPPWTIKPLIAAAKRAIELERELLETKAELNTERAK